MTKPSDSKQEKTYWLDDRRNVNGIIYVIYAVCALLLMIDPFVHKHGPFQIEHLIGFYGLFAFLVCVALVLFAKEILRRFLMRPEDYYDD